MQLIYSPASPYARKVRMVAIERGLADDVKVLTASPFDEPAKVNAVNPLGKVPALVLEGGEALYDSPVICEYLDSLGEGSRLIPAVGAARWAVLRLQALGDGVLDAALSLVMERRRPEAERSAHWQARWSEAMLRALAAAASEPALAGPEANLGQITVACALGYLDFRLPDLAWRAASPALAAWFETWAARPSFAATAPV